MCGHPKMDSNCLIFAFAPMENGQKQINVHRMIHNAVLCHKTAAIVIADGCAPQKIIRRQFYALWFNYDNTHLFYKFCGVELSTPHRLINCSKKVNTKSNQTSVLLT